MVIIFLSFFCLATKKTSICVLYVIVFSSLNHPFLSFAKSSAKTTHRSMNSTCVRVQILSIFATLTSRQSPHSPPQHVVKSRATISFSYNNDNTASTCSSSSSQNCYSFYRKPSLLAFSPRLTLHHESR